MKTGILVVLLAISVLEQLSPGDGANLTQENLESKCNGYCSTILKPSLDNAVLSKSEGDTNNELSGQVAGGYIKDLQNQLAIAENQIKFNEALTILQSQLANAECQVKLKDLIIVKDKEIHEKTEQLKCNDNLIKSKNKEIDVQNEQIKYYNEKVNNMTERIRNLQTQLVNAEDQIKINDKEIKNNEDQIKDQTNQIQNKDEELVIKSNAVRDLSAQISTKDSQIYGLNNQIKSVSEELLNNENNMTEIIRNLQTQLVNAEAQIKINDKEIKNNENQIKDQTNQIQNKDEELIIKSNAVRDLSAQISMKDSQISGLNNQIKSVSEDLERSTKYYGTDECPKSGPSGIYVLKVPGNVLMEVPCNSTGWIVVLRRQDGSVDFKRSWKEYKEGFGNLTGEFFIGLEKLHQLTKRQPHEVYIKLVTVNGAVIHAQYDNFKVSNEENKYRLDSVGTYSGTAGDSLSYNAGKSFSTTDRDNDGYSGDCAKDSAGGGWWYGACSYSLLTGKFYKDGISPSEKGINWYYYRNDYMTSFTYVEMLIKPK